MEILTVASACANWQQFSSIMLVPVILSVRGCSVFALQIALTFIHQVKLLKHLYHEETCQCHIVLGCLVAFYEIWNSTIHRFCVATCCASILLRKSLGHRACRSMVWQQRLNACVGNVAIAELCSSVLSQILATERGFVCAKHLWWRTCHGSLRGLRTGS